MPYGWFRPVARMIGTPASAALPLSLASTAASGLTTSDRASPLPSIGAVASVAASSGVVPSNVGESNPASNEAGPPPPPDELLKHAATPEEPARKARVQ